MKMGKYEGLKIREYENVNIRGFENESPLLLLFVQIIFMQVGFHAVEVVFGFEVAQQ